MSVIATCSAGLSSILSFFILCASTIFKVAVATKIAETAIDAYQIELLKITETNEYVPMTCIQVDSPDELFVTNNFIVTHNTQVLTERARKLLREGTEPSDIACITFTTLAA